MRVGQRTEQADPEVPRLGAEGERPRRVVPYAGAEGPERTSLRGGGELPDVMRSEVTRGGPGCTAP